MIRTILAFFGYMKVPVEAVQLSELVTSFIREAEKKSGQAEKLLPYFEASKTITKFLRSGRLLS